MNQIKAALKKPPIILWFILALIAMFSIHSSQYLTVRNLMVLLQQGSVLLVVATAATFVIISGGLDLSLGGILTLSGVVAALTVNAGMPIPVAFLAGGLVGFLCGLVNGLLISVCRLQPFITTLGTQGIFYGIALVLTNKQGIPVSRDSFVMLGALLSRVVPMAAICCGILYVFAIIIQDHTRLGRYSFAIGGNEEGARLSGINTRLWKCMVYAFAGLLTGLAAVILVARLEVADPLVGTKWEFEAIACAILGGTSMNIGRGDVKGTILGVILLTIIRSGLNVARVPSLWQSAVVGTILILAIVFQVSITERRKTGGPACVIEK